MTSIDYQEMIAFVVIVAAVVYLFCFTFDNGG